VKRDRPPLWDFHSLSYSKWYHLLRWWFIKMVVLKWNKWPVRSISLSILGDGACVKNRIHFFNWGYSFYALLRILPNGTGFAPLLYLKGLLYLVDICIQYSFRCSFGGRGRCLCLYYACDQFKDKMNLRHGGSLRYKVVTLAAFTVPWLKGREKLLRITCSKSITGNCSAFKFSEVFLLEICFRWSPWWRARDGN
jgi:hypothetical protein